ncbi:hypothetical protein EH243_17655 [Amphritea opalescens]|uniref:Uncharacterized protein n=1 Tax=Amphritea opalescens TaxID=2490544 RepID=A0A430KLS6_9GAMM|nr:hypothetical protein [Amphritea opalescens]RTE64394.1 hypothetical protein EH243_17655 [Amphritea opalescens]
MTNQKEKMKWVLFWVFLILFVVMVLGTLAMVFLGFGSPTESERELMVKGLIGEVAACIIALFYSIFGLKGGAEETDKLQELESKIEHLLSVIETFKLSDKKSRVVPLSSVEQVSTSASVESVAQEDFEGKVYVLGTEPAFPITEYELKPLPSDIKKDIRKAKPLDVKHRKSSYKGMKVQWRALLSTVEEKGDNKLRITADLDDSLLFASFEVEKNTNNTLLIADEGEPFWLCGEIIEAESYTIELGKVKLKFRET